MSSILSNYLGNALLTQYFYGKATYLALHTSDPTVAGLLATEVAGGDYAREATLWTPPSSKTIGLASPVSYEDLPACVITYFAVWNHPTAGNMLAAKLLSPALTMPDSGQLIVPAGDVAITV